MSRSSLEPQVWALPQGRHGLTRDLVAGSQRQRLMYAVTVATAELGFGAMTVADVIERSGVSRRTFYEHFKDKLDCFLAAFDLGREALISATMAAAAEPVDDPFLQLHSVIETYLGVAASEPAFARAFFVEVHGAGAEAVARRVECRQQLIALLTFWHAGLEVAGHPEYTPVPATAFTAAIGAADTLVGEYLRANPPEGLLSIAPDVEYSCLALLSMPLAAAAVIRPPA